MADDIVRRMELMDVPPGSYDEETLYDVSRLIERLRAAGDEMADAATRQQWSRLDVAVAAWNEARRG